MRVSFDTVSLEDIQQQLKLLGHHVPDDLVTAYLQEVQENSRATSSRVNSADVQQPGSTINAAAAGSEAADFEQPHEICSQSQEVALKVASGGSTPPSGHFSGQEAVDHHHRYGSSGTASQLVAGSSLQNESGLVEVRSLELEANSTGFPASPPHQTPYQNEQASGHGVDLPSPADCLHPDHLLPADVLQRARSIINEHLAEHKMPLVDSLSEFKLEDAPEAVHKGMGSVDNSNRAGPPRSRMANSKAATDALHQDHLAHDAHKIPHTTARAARRQQQEQQHDPPSASKCPSIAPKGHTPALFSTYGSEDCENAAEKPDHIDALMVRLRRGSSSRRSALESLEGTIFDNEQGCNHSNQHSSAKPLSKRRPATAGTRRNEPYVSGRARPCSHRYSHTGMVDDQEQFQNPYRHEDQDQFQNSHGDGALNASTSGRHWERPQSHRNSGFLTGRSCPGGHPRKVDRVARYHQLSKQWSRDPFLSGTSRRRPQGFQEAFTAAHERSRAGLDAAKAMNASDRPRTACRQPYVPPGEKRRDRLRWDVRTRMHIQDGL